MPSTLVRGGAAATAGPAMNSAPAAPAMFALTRGDASPFRDSSICAYSPPPTSTRAPTARPPVTVSWICFACPEPNSVPSLFRATNERMVRSNSSPNFSFHGSGHRQGPGPGGGHLSQTGIQIFSRKQFHGWVTQYGAGNGHGPLHVWPAGQIGVPPVVQGPVVVSAENFPASI